MISNSPDARHAYSDDGPTTAFDEGDLPAKSPLTAEELEEFRQLLLAKLRSIVGDMDGIAAEARGEGPNGVHAGPADPAGQVEVFPDDVHSDRELTMGLLANERRLVREVTEALERIGKGTYGICLGTGKPIGVSRLRARPWARFCIEHARALEKRAGPSALSGCRGPARPSMRFGEDASPADIDNRATSHSELLAAEADEADEA